MGLYDREEPHHLDAADTMDFQSDCSVFDMFHPVVVLLYCGVLLAFSMVVMQPVYLLLTLGALLAFKVSLQGVSALRGLLWQAPLVLFLAVANPLFASVGSTELFRIGLHAIYLEAIVYGFCQGLMLVNVLLAFSCAAMVLSSDKVLCVLGNVMPTVSLMVSMTMRLIPQFAGRGKTISAVQQACTASQDSRVQLDDFGRKESRRSRIRDYLRLSTVLMSWGMEDSLETADAIRARGWGAVKKRTSYRRYRFRGSDAIACLMISALGIAAALAAFVACSQFAFYPQVVGFAPWFSYAPYVAFLALPTAFVLWGRRLWS